MLDQGESYRNLIKDYINGQEKFRIRHKGPVKSFIAVEVCACVCVVCFVLFS